MKTFILDFISGTRPQGCMYLVHVKGLVHPENFRTIHTIPKEQVETDHWRLLQKQINIGFQCNQEG